MKEYKNKYTFLQKVYLYLHGKIYSRRLKNQIRFHDKYVISIGNLSAGGTGKTPLTAFLAHKFKKDSPLAVLRGYGGKEKKPLLVSDGKKILSNYLEAGDEAIQLSHIPGLRVAVSRDRSEAIRLYSEKSKLILLDDAFQNPRVYRDHELVLIDASIPPEKVKVFPSGHFRDDFSALTRADTILLTRSDQISLLEKKRWIQILKKEAPGKKVFESHHKPSAVLPLLRKQKVGAFCGIGNPESFFRILRSSGYTVEKSFIWQDHHIFTEKDIEFLKSWKLPLITTEKDAVRLISLQSEKNMHIDFHVLKIEIKIKNEKDFLRAIRNIKN